jgi:hypothetical protein
MRQRGNKAVRQTATKQAANWTKGQICKAAVGQKPIRETGKMHLSKQAAWQSIIQAVSLSGKEAMRQPAKKATR